MTISTQGWLTAYDATTWQAEDDLPAAGLYFLYNDANYAAPSAAYSRFGAEGHRIATICVNNTTVANEYDYETGNQNDPVPWARMMRAKYNYLGVIYVSTDRAQEVLDLFSAAGEAAPYFRLANWTGSPPSSVPDFGAGTVGIQFTDQGDGGQVDISLVSPSYPVIGGAAAPAPSGGPLSAYQQRATHNTFTEIAVDGLFQEASWKAAQYVLLGSGGVSGKEGPVTDKGFQVMLHDFEGTVLAVDGSRGLETTKAIQQKLDIATDGVWGQITSRTFQIALNAGTFWGEN